MSDNFFSDLGLDPYRNYSKEEIKKAWRELCKKHHPDVGGDPITFRKINHAYNMLTDPSYRHKVDKKDKICLDTRIQIPVSFEDAFFGNKIVFSFNRFEISESGDLVSKIEQDIITETIDYPAGTLAGLSKTIIGAGLKQGEKYGNCVIDFVVGHHSRYKIDQNGNIFTKEMIELETMLKGGVIEVQTMYGLETVKIPPGTGPNDKIRIRNCGILRLADHLIEPVPIFPTKADLRAKKKFNDLDINWQEFEEQRKEITFNVDNIKFTFDGFDIKGDNK